MIGDMPKPRPPYLLRERSRHGKTCWYVRIGKGPRTRIDAPFDSVEFWAAYHAAVGDESEPPRGGKETLGRLIGAYRESSAWRDLSPATRRQRENIFKHVIKAAGDIPVSRITRAKIIEGRESRKETPAQANNFLKAMRGLFQWAIDVEHVTTDPTAAVGWLKVRTEGFHVWTEDEVEKFEARWALGTRERVAFDVLLYTGLRRGDAVRLGRQHVREGVFTIRTEKTGTEIVAPILPALAKSLEAGPTGDLHFIVGENGRPMKKESFGNWFREACKAAGVPGSAHGLRKAGATRAANNGLSERQLEAIFGWTGGKMASLYTKNADRARLAREAMSALEREPNKVPLTGSGPGAGNL